MKRICAKSLRVKVYADRREMVIGEDSHEKEDIIRIRVKAGAGGCQKLSWNRGG